LELKTLKVLFVSANTEPINMPILPVGLGAVATASRDAGHEVELLDLMRVTDTGSAIKEAVERFLPHVIGIGVRNIDDQNMKNPIFLLDQVKEVISHCRHFSEAPIVLGGAGYSMFPESALTYLGADMGIQGEGEIAFPELLQLMEQGSDLSEAAGLYLPGLGLQGKRTFARNLDVFPFPSVSLWPAYLSKDPDLWVPIQTRKGCSMDCSYCSTALIEGRIMRKHSPERAVDLITRYFEAGCQRFFFVDNTFNMPRSYAREICRALNARGMGISWRCIIYPGTLDEGLAKDMARAGCRGVSLGFESGCERILKSMNKKFTLEAARQTSEMLGDQGIHRMGFLLLGGPGETKESVQESLAFVESLRLEAVKITVGIRIYPGTALARTAKQEGVISDEGDLLFPRFYIARGLEDWLPETVGEWMAGRPHWTS
jgi:radical SAM superfamily enzyme YgiQ (UPF0313 family)